MNDRATVIVVVTAMMALAFLPFVAAFLEVYLGVRI